MSFGALSFLGTTAVGLFTSVFIARLYGVNVVGEFALAYAPVGAAWLLSTVREQPALQREAAVLPPRHPRVTGLFLAVFTFSSLLTVAVSALTALVTYLLFHGPIHQPELFLPAVASLVGYTLFTNTCVNFDSIFIAFRDGRQLFWLRLHQAVLYLILVIAGRLVSGSVWSLVVTTALAWFPPCIHRAIAARKWLTYKISRAEARAGFDALPEMLRFGLKLTPAGLIGGASDQLGTWVLGSLSSIAAVGAFNRAWFLGQRFLEARLRLSELLFPTLVERRLRDDRTGIERALIDLLRYSLGFMLLFASVGGGAAPAIMSVFGPGFDRAAPALVYLLLVPAVTTVTTVLSQALIAEGRALVTGVTNTVRAVTTLGAVILLTRSMGITGTAIGMALGAVAQLVWQLTFVQPGVFRQFGKWWPRRQLVGQGAAYVGGFIAARATIELLPGYAGLAVSLLLGSLLYSAVALLVCGLLPRDRVRAHMVIDRVSQRLRQHRGFPAPDSAVADAPSADRAAPVA